MDKNVFFLSTFQNSESHSAQWEKLVSQHSGLKTILDVVNKPQGLALIFSHDDPDGITSGLIFKRLLEKKGWKVSWELPEGFALLPEQFEKSLQKNPNAKAVFILDKGTLPVYSPFGKRIPLYVIDHHPTPQPPTDCTVFNPALEKYVPCSASVLAHGISVCAGTRDSFDDFLALVGLKGDWAIEPVRGIAVDFVKPFLKDYAIPFEKLFNLVNEPPTMFDAEQREQTCLLSRVTEFVHAVGGGGFQYFYNDRDESLRNVNHPECIAFALDKISSQIEKIKIISTLNDFINLLPVPERGLLIKIFSFFQQDWQKASNLLDSSSKAIKFGDTAIYLFVGGKVPLLPMIGSIKLFDLKQRENEKLAQIIMISSVSSEYTHVSVRASGDQVHSGRFCGRLADALQKEFPEFKGKISGGGHPRAAECTVRTGQASFPLVIERVVGQLNEMARFNNKWAGKSLSDEQKKEATEIGLDFLRQ